MIEAFAGFLLRMLTTAVIIILDHEWSLSIWQSLKFGDSETGLLVSMRAN